jgi:thiol-disulfide isomerase/thioredoxin
VALLATQSWFLLRLTRQNNTLLRALAGTAGTAGTEVSLNGPHAHDESPEPTGLPVGSPAPRFTLPDLRGSMVTLDDLLADGKPVMLFFTSPNCGPCSALIPEIARWQREYPTRLTIAVIGEGSVEINEPKAAEAGLRDLLLQREREIAEAYDLHGTPGAVIVYPEGVIASPVALGADSIRGLLAQVLDVVASPLIALQNQVHVEERPDQEPAAGRHAVSVGDLLPDLSVTELMGGTIDLPDLIDGETLLLFWSSTCGFCAQMEPTLKTWELNPPPGAPSLVIILQPTTAGKQVVNFRSTIVIDRDGAVARALGANGTPMGILVDAEGRVASPVAAGEPEVMELAQGRIPNAARSA